VYLGPSFTASAAAGGPLAYRHQGVLKIFYHLNISKHPHYMINTHNIKSLGNKYILSYNFINLNDLFETP
jgi:hypothetical protein